MSRKAKAILIFMSVFTAWFIALISVVLGSAYILSSLGIEISIDWGKFILYSLITLVPFSLLVALEESE